MAVVFRIRAEADLVEIGDFIALDNPARARTFVDELVDRCLEVALHPRAARERSEIGEGVRLIVHKRYVVLYRIEGEDIVILRVVHGARDLLRLEL